MVFPRKPRTGFKMLENPKEFIDKDSSFFCFGFPFPIISHCPSTNLQVRLLVSGCCGKFKKPVFYIVLFFPSLSRMHSFTWLCLKMACIPSNMFGHVQRESQWFSITKISEGISGFHLFSDTPKVSYCCFCAYIYIFFF